MALLVKDRVKETTTVTGTGTASLAGAVVGYVSFSTALTDADTTYYAIISSDELEWEVGLGTYSSSTLSRTTVLSSSNSNNLVTFSAGEKEVFITYPAEKAIYLDGAGNLNLGGGTVDGVNLANISIVQSTAPTTPTEGDYWYNDTTLTQYIYYNSAWIQVASYSGWNILADTGTALNVESGNIVRLQGGSGVSTVVSQVTVGATVYDNIVISQDNSLGLQLPSFTTTQKNALANTAGIVVYDSTLGKMCFNTGSGWQTITSS